MDLYRLEEERELNDLGWEEFAFSTGVTLIEWAEKIIPFLPSDYIEVNFQWLDQNTRELTFVGHGGARREYNQLIREKMERGEMKWL